MELRPIESPSKYTVSYQTTTGRGGPKHEREVGHGAGNEGEERYLHCGRLRTDDEDVRLDYI